MTNGINGKSIMMVFMLFFLDPRVSGSKTERIDESLCHSDSNRTLSCPDEHFIDILRDGVYSPLAVFVKNYSCPEASSRATVVSNINLVCQRNTTYLFTSCHGKEECYLDPRILQNIELKDIYGCPSNKPNIMFFSYRCFHINSQNNVAVMASEVFRNYTASYGNIFSPNFPGPVPELGQLANCTLTSRSWTEITINIQYLYLNDSNTNAPLCDQRLEFTTSMESKKTYCNPHPEMGAIQENFIIPIEVGEHLNIIFNKCSKIEGGKFWIHFTATRGIDVQCSDNMWKSYSSSCNTKNGQNNLEGATSTPLSAITSKTEDLDEQSLGIILGVVLGVTFCILLLMIVIIFFILRTRRMRKRKESSGSERSFTVVERIPVQDKQKILQQNNCSDAENVSVTSTLSGGTSLTVAHTIAKSSVDEDNNKSTATSDISSPTEITSVDDALASGADTKIVLESHSPNRENTYAKIDKSRKDLKQRKVSGYEKVVGFAPRIDIVENLTGSDTFMCENDLYGKIISQSQPSKIEILNEEKLVDMNDASDGKTENKCTDSNGSPKEEMREELNENTDTQHENHENTFISVDNNNESSVTEHEEIVDKDDPSDDILDQSHVQEKPTDKSRLCAVNSETIMKENMDIYSDALPATEADDF